MTQRDQVAVLLARDEIRQLPYHYAAAIESRDVDAMADLFSPNARFGEHGDGPNGLRQLMTRSLDDSVFAVILVANHIIEFDGHERASGQVWAHCYAQTRSHGFVEQLIKYQDRYERHDGRWLFLHRKHRLWYGVGHRDSPLRQPAANWPQSQVGVGDLPIADPVFRDWWEKRS
ncbi:nuclear transport factor 2 family protein [Mycolicibacterium sp. 120270]|uniref:nuclear transport factor 2 family protein n=1 Tax=Mycolicibacterium sp. 120270 TaxID=3090600 RepID=UPI00299F27C3|nr:nuclear transport factor 2 family protein [Mycolicibacterium sp. 120270]MDX1882241.1 nuclear transport factor 2 family protein [Mycolicibacterium sp. 120270]